LHMRRLPAGIYLFPALIGAAISTANMQSQGVGREKK
jgi:hypothetical protein